MGLPRSLVHARNPLGCCWLRVLRACVCNLLSLLSLTRSSLSLSNHVLVHLFLLSLSLSLCSISPDAPLCSLSNSPLCHISLTASLKASLKTSCVLLASHAPQKPLFLTLAALAADTPSTWPSRHALARPMPLHGHAQQAITCPWHPREVAQKQGKIAETPHCQENADPLRIIVLLAEHTLPLLPKALLGPWPLACSPAGTHCVGGVSPRTACCSAAHNRSRADVCHIAHRY